MKIGQGGRGMENKEMGLLVEVRFLEHNAATLTTQFGCSTATHQGFQV